LFVTFPSPYAIQMSCLPFQIPYTIGMLHFLNTFRALQKAAYVGHICAHSKYLKFCNFIIILSGFPDGKPVMIRQPFSVFLLIRFPVFPFRHSSMPFCLFERDL